MEKTIKQLTGEIKGKRNLEQNLPLLMNLSVSAYGMLALYNFSMELSMFLDEKTEGALGKSTTEQEQEKVLLSVVKEVLLSNFDPEVNKAAIETMLCLRENITKKMEILTAYTDEFILYEYMRNRLEPRFETSKDTAELILAEDTAREILQWIFSDQESTLVNERIKEMLSCLPVRMTKGKIAELVENAFSLYKEADKKSIDMFAYMLRSASGLYSPEGMEQEFEELYHYKTALKALNTDAMTSEQYERMKQQIEEAGSMVRDLSEYFNSLQILTNGLLTILLARPYFTMEAEKDSTQPLTIIRELLNRADVDPDSLFTGVEHKMEAVSERVMQIEPLLSFATEELGKEISQLMLSCVHQRILMAQRLNSGSTFAGLQEEEEGKLPEGYLVQTMTSFLAELRAALETGSRLRNRAVMAAILRELPVFFQSHTEVMNYVRNSLEGCHDEGEKRIGVELLRSYYA